MVHRARAGPAGLIRRLVLVERPAPVAAGLPTPVSERLEAGALVEKTPARLGIGRVRADAVEPLKGERLGDVRVPGDERLVRDGSDHELEREPLRVGEAEPVILARRLHALGAKPLLPKVERLARADAPDDRVHHPRSGLAR